MDPEKKRKIDMLTLHDLLAQHPCSMYIIMYVRTYACGMPLVVHMRNVTIM